MSCNTLRARLCALHGDIDARVLAIRENHTDWLCGKGCDACCRRLAEVPQLTAEEWGLLQEGLRELPAERLGEIRREIAALAVQQSRPLACPLLDRLTGACPVYAQRPVACRTYGFYVVGEFTAWCNITNGEAPHHDTNVPLPQL